MDTQNKYKKIINELISKGIEFKLHNDLPVIYSKNKVDSNLYKLAKNNREGIARLLIDEKKRIFKKYNNSENTEKEFFRIILEEKFHIKF